MEGETMTPDRKNLTAGFWITVALVALLVGYPLSIGPAWWLQRRLVPNYSPRMHASIGAFYRPLWRATGPQFTPVREALVRYTDLFVPREPFARPDHWHEPD